MLLIRSKKTERGNKVEKKRETIAQNKTKSSQCTFKPELSERSKKVRI